MQYLKIALITLLTTTSFYGCSTIDNKKIFYKTGKEAYVVNCSGTSWINCYQNASQICKDNGYEINERASSRVSGFFSTSDYREMIITCNEQVNQNKSIAEPKPNNDQNPQEDNKKDGADVKSESKL